MRPADVDARALAVVNRLAAGAALLVALAGCSKEEPLPPVVPNTILVASPAFPGGGHIPAAFTCDSAREVSPPLRWSQLPDAAVELAIVVHDPDAPGGSFTHWVVTGIDPGSDGAELGQTPRGGAQGRNDFGSVGWRGPCPPRTGERHRYVFTLYALRIKLPIEGPATRADVLRLLPGRAVARGELLAFYGRNK